VAPDYHIEIAGHFYSVPSRLIREIVDVRITAETVEIFHKGNRLASHARSHLRHRHTTTPEHMPSAHRRYAEWTPARMMSEAAKVGPATTALFEAIMKAKPHPEQGFRSCLGHHQPRQELRSRARRSGLSTRQRHRRDHLRIDRVDPQEWSRQGLHRARSLRSPGGQRRCVPSRQHPRA
jgi:transposase